MKAIKQTIGVDVAQDELVCSFGLLFEDLSWQIKARKTFGNPKGVWIYVFYSLYVV